MGYGKNKINIPVATNVEWNKNLWVQTHYIEGGTQYTD